MVYQSIKEPAQLLCLEETTFYWVASGFQFDIMNITFLPYLPLAYSCTTPFGACSLAYTSRCTL